MIVPLPLADILPSTLSNQTEICASSQPNGIV